VIALADCNSFYAACEKVFRPDLKDRPVVILSNNDGCVVALSSEAKAAGIPRGTPFYQIRQKLKAINAVVFSSNYTLYQDLSFRVMDCFRDYSDHVNIYSIDEAFLDVPVFSCKRDFLEWGYGVKDNAFQITGLPVSVGIAPTCTLAKLAAGKAKKSDGVYFLEESQRERVLKDTPVGGVWGIGSRKARFLEGKGIGSAYDLCRQDDAWIKEKLTITTLRTVWELKGIPSIEEDPEASPKKGILTSRGFGKAVSEKKLMEEAASSYAAQAVKKLNRQNSKATIVSVFITSNRFSEGFYSNTASLELAHPSNYLPEIAAAAHQCLDKIFREGVLYVKLGVFLSGIDPPSVWQPDLFEVRDESKDKMAKIVYELNQKMGYDAVKISSSLASGDWQMKRDKLSRRYTTRWDELQLVY